MNSFLKTAAVAATAAVVTWTVRRVLDRRYAPVPRAPRKPVENWENEGGALAPHPAGLETSQVPR